MPAGFYTPTSDIEPIVGIQMCVFSPEEIERRSVVEITNAGTYEGNEPKIAGLFDPRMGVLDNGKECRSCGQTNHKCPGHFGHFRLARPVYYFQFFPYILNILSCVCVRCSKVLIDKTRNKSLLKKRTEARWRDVLTKCKEIKRCGQDTEDGCGTLQPSRYRREGIARIVAEWDNAIDMTDKTIQLLQGSEREQVNDMKSQKQPLEVEYVLRLFRRITDEDVDFMGLNRYWCRPEWMICTVLPIPPPQVRPSVIQDNNQRSEDDLTHKLAEIIKTNNTYLQAKIQANAAKSMIDEWTNVLQYHIATLVDNQIPGVAPSAQRNGRPLKSIQQRLGSKEGRIRYNIQGKRVEMSARSVITPDPNISIAELGVPEKIAMNLSRPETVTMYNKERMYRYVLNGPNKHPGAKTIRRMDGRIISLKHVNTKEIILHDGDVVNRHLMDGDIVLFNRQPTLHRMSMMGHRVKVLKYKTFRLNVSVTAPYNADFDGDEMNMHCPQSLEAATELEEIAAVPHQIVSPRHALPLIGIVQDTLVGSYRLTRDNVYLNKAEFMNLMMWNKKFNGILPEPKGENEKFTGHQVISQLLPPINLDMNNSSKKKVLIREGEVIEGQFDKSIYSKASKGIVHVTFNDYGSNETVNLIDSLQNTIEQFLVYNGFSVGISDLIADVSTKEEMNKKIKEKKSDVETILLQLHQDLFDNNTGKTNQAEFEDKAFGLLNKATELAGETGYGSLANENRMTAMIRAGSKGGPINIAQMIACVGQQNIDGKRIPYGFEDRTLPHYKRYDDGPAARGFIENSFITGLTPQEFFFHAMSGREGLIDTAVKTAETGYIQRQLVKAMEDLVVHYDGTVRDANMGIAQFYYGEDGINATKIENQELDLVTLTNEQIATDFALQGVDLGPILAEGVDRGDDEAILKAYAEDVMTDRKMMVEGVFRSGNQGSVYAAVNLERLILNIKTKFRLNDQQRTNLTPSYIIQGIQSVLDKTQRFHQIWAALLRYYLSPTRIIIKDRFTQSAFDTLCEVLVTKNWNTWVQPGEQVGIIAAQSIGEPATQMTLNTFHLAGVASKSNVTRGVPRLKELLKVSQNPKATSLTIPLKPEYANNKNKAREVSQELELTLLRDMTVKTAIYYDPSDSNSVLKEDRELLEFYKLFETNEVGADVKAWSKWMLRIELNRQNMFDKNITMEDINYVLNQRFGDELKMVYSDFNSQKLVMRIRFNLNEIQANEIEQMDHVGYYKKFQNKLLNAVIIRGVPGIKAATFRKGEARYFFNPDEGKYETKEEYILDTDGSNFLEAMNHPAVDATRIYSTHVHDIHAHLGIEATRAVLFNEIQTLFSAGDINYRHLGLLVDVMCRSGRLMSVDRYGINKLNIGPLAKASFEETERILLKAAVFGEVDPITGVSANIMTGQTIRGGTAFADILLDEVAVMRLQKNLPPAGAMDFEEEAPTEDEINTELEYDPNDICSTTRLKMNMAMPKSNVMIDEDDVELIEIQPTGEE
jgi:DNA-directed RNA polymerase II subunit RPB1